MEWGHNKEESQGGHNVTLPYLFNNNQINQYYFNQTDQYLIIKMIFLWFLLAAFL